MMAMVRDIMVVVLDIIGFFGRIFIENASR